MRNGGHSHLRMVPAKCCVCEGPASQIGSGFDFEYRTSPDLFRAMQCQGCGTVFLDPRPAESEFEKIYPADYHTLEFSEANYSLVHKIRSRLEARRLLTYCAEIGGDARILDVGCGDGFHLDLLRQFGNSSWRLEGIDMDGRAVGMARAAGLSVQLGTLEEVGFEANSFDLVYTIQTLEHVARPDQFLEQICRILKPGGRLVIVTDNTSSIDFGLFKTRYWGGYHFPRHWYLFNKTSLARLGALSGFTVDRIGTIVSPVNWVYSIHNLLVGRGAPRWLSDRFTLRSPVSLAFFTVVDSVLGKFGRGALLNAFFTKS